MIDLKRIARLIKKTKDKYIISDATLGDFVVLSLADYEKYVYGTSAPVDSVGIEVPDELLADQGFDEKGFNEELAKKVDEDRYYFEPVDDDE